MTHIAVLEVGDEMRSVVVKSTPPGRKPTGRHDVLRQARVLAAVARWGGVPVPAVLFADDGPQPFYGMDCVAGTASDPVIGVPAPGESEPIVRGAWDAATMLLARLHEAPLGDLALEGEPIREPGDELGVWVATMDAAGMGDAPRTARLRAALEREVPPRRSRAALVHGDYRLGNLIMDGADPRALIDWEIWSVGDPAVDLGWFVQFTDPGNFPGVGRSVRGTPTAQAVVARYLDLVGDGERERIPWFLALGCFKLAAIQAHNRRRHLEGRYHDEYQEALGPSIERLLERGMDWLGASL